MLHPKDTKSAKLADRITNPLSIILLSFSLLLTACSGGSDNADEDPNTETPDKEQAIAPAGENWTFCAKQDETCEFTGTHEVAYGNDTQFNFANHNDGVNCTTDIFSDPAPGKAKYCWSKPISETQTTSININANNTAQSIVMMGGDMERSHRNFDKLANQQEVIQWLAADIQFDTWRVAYDKHQESIEGVKDFSVYDNAVKAMQMIKAVNPQIKFFASLESDYNGYSQGNHNNLPTFIYDYSYENGAPTGSKAFDAQKYGLFLADYVEYMEQSGVPLTYLATSKEYVGVITADRAKTAINTLINELDSRDIAIPKIIDAGTWSLSNGIKLINNYVSKDINQYVYGYSSHDYWSAETKTWQDFATVANEAGKFAFNEESAHGGGGPTMNEADFNNVLGAYSQKVKMYSGGIQGEAFFELWPRGYNEISTNQYFAKPVFFNNGTDGRRMRAYYIMQKFVNNAVDSVYVKSDINSLTDIESMVFKKGDSLALWLINQAESAQSDIHINVTELGLKSGMAVQQTYWTESADIKGVSSTLLLENDEQFATSLPGRSLTLLLIKPDYQLTASISKNNGEWLTASQISVDEGDSVSINLNANATGEWTWQGPNDFTANSESIELENITAAMAGEYQASFTDTAGITNSLSTLLTVNCHADPETTATYQINDNTWVSNQTVLPVEAGDTMRLAVQADADGDWSWTGPQAFKYAGQQLEITNLKPDMAGTYVATYTSPQGCSTNVEYDVSVSCALSPTIIPKMQIAGVWSETSALEFRTGDTIQIGPNTPDTGRWQWSGPNNFNAIEIRQLQFQNASQDIAGDYQVTLTNPQGCSASQTFTLTHVEGECTPASITPYIRINQGEWVQTNQASLKVGDTIDIGPQPHGGTWQWTGPQDYSSDARQIQLTNLTIEQAGTYTATYTPENGGCKGVADIELSISD